MIYRRGNIWWLEYKDRGSKVRSSLGTSDRVEAMLIADVRLAERAAQQARSALAAKTGDGAFVWAMERWSRMNHRERQAVVFAAFRGKCVYCSCEVSIPLARDPKSATRAVLDHKVPVSGGGSDALGNMVLACQACNFKKHDGAAE